MEPALELGLLHFDVCLAGERAPLSTVLARALENAHREPGKAVTHPLVRRVVRQARGRVGPEVRLARLLDVRQVHCGVRRGPEHGRLLGAAAQSRHVQARSRAPHKEDGHSDFPVIVV